jgi:hypothetical protein
VQATVNPEKAVRAIDGDLETRWDSGVQRPGVELTLDLGRVETVHGIALLHGASRRDFPRGLRIEVAGEDGAWRLLVQGELEVLPITAFLEPRELPLDIPMAPTEARFIRFTTIRGHDRFYWSVHEIEVW